MVQPVGTLPRTRTAGTVTDPIPRMTVSAATPDSSRRSRARTSTPTASAALTTPAATTPPGPDGHGAEATGNPAAPCAMRPMPAAGTHPTVASKPAPTGHTGASRHAASPTIVATGASTSASRFAGTAYVGRAGASGIVTGQQATCAAIGIATAAAMGVQTHRASRSVSGAARTTMPTVASTDSAKANERATHGSATSMPTAARAMSGTPRTGRPLRCTTSTTIAITVARVIDGSGRTSTTNPSSTTTAAAARRTLGAPVSRPSSTTRPTSTAQFDPETAVRWVSAEVSIACSVSASSPNRSPIASPRRSAPPGSGRSAVTATNAARASALAPRSPVGPARVATAPRAKSTTLVVEPGSSRCSCPRTETTVPAASTARRGSSSAGTSRTGTRRPSDREARPTTASIVPTTDRSPGARSRSSRTRASTL